MASNTTPHHSGKISVFDKVTGKTKILPRELNIIWGKDSRYWNVPENDDSPAELYQVCWLEVTGGVEGISATANYEVGFRVSLNPDAFGWGNYPIYIMIKRGKDEKPTWTKVPIKPNQTEPFEIKGKIMKSDTTKSEGSENEKLTFGLYEVWSGKWKGGLKIHHAYVNKI